jgi:hypothetical protein
VLLNERRTGFGKLAIAGACAGTVAGAVFAPVSFAMVALFGQPSSTFVLVLFALPVYVFVLSFAGAIVISGVAASAAVLPPLRARAANLIGGRKTIRRVTWVGGVIGVVTAAANFYVETANQALK